MHAIQVTYDKLEDEIDVRPDNVLLLGEVVHVYNQLNGESGYYALITEDMKGPFRLCRLQNYQYKGPVLMCSPKE